MYKWSSDKRRRPAAPDEEEEGPKRTSFWASERCKSSGGRPSVEAGIGGGRDEGEMLNFLAAFSRVEERSFSSFSLSGMAWMRRMPKSEEVGEEGICKRAGPKPQVAWRPALGRQLVLMLLMSLAAMEEVME